MWTPESIKTKNARTQPCSKSRGNVPVHAKIQSNTIDDPCAWIHDIYGNQAYAIKVVWHFEEVVLLRGEGGREK